MGKRRDWSKIGEVVEKIPELELTYREGAPRFGVKVSDLYEFNHRDKRQSAEGNGRQFLRYITQATKIINHG